MTTSNLTKSESALWAALLNAVDDSYAVTSHLRMSRAQMIAATWNSIAGSTVASHLLMSERRLLAGLVNEVAGSTVVSHLTHSMEAMLAVYLNEIDDDAGASHLRMSRTQLLAAIVDAGGGNDPLWLPKADGINADRYADYTTEGLTNHYWAAGAVQVNAAAYHSTIGATHSRASTAVRRTAAGLLESVSTDVLRFTHDLSNNPIGIFLEGARTNECLQSEDITAGEFQIFGTGFTRTANAGTAPNGTSTADRFQAVSPSANAHGLQNDVSLSGGTANKVVTVSVWAKSNTGSNQSFRLGNTQSLVASSFSSNLTATTEWQKFSFTRTNTASAGDGIQRVQITPSSGNADFDILVWGFQMEQAAFASSYIQTTSGTVTRAADSLARTRASPTVISKKISAVTAPGTGAQVLWQIDDGTAANRILVWRNTSNEIHVTVVISSSNVADLNLGAVGANTAIKVAFRASANDFAACLDGGSMVTDTSGNMPTGMVNERWGADSSGNQWFGTIKDDAEWGVALTDSALQAA